MEEIIWITVLLSAGIAVGVLTVRFLARSRGKDIYYDVLRIEDGRLITFYHGLCGTAEEIYALDEICVVRFFCRSIFSIVSETRSLPASGCEPRVTIWETSFVPS